jgi:hypothetical protein
VSWQGRQLRVRHDPRIGPYTPRGAVIRSAMELASDAHRLRLVLASAVGDRYTVKVSENGQTVAQQRRAIRSEWAVRAGSKEHNPM